MARVSKRRIHKGGLDISYVLVDGRDADTIVAETPRRCQQGDVWELGTHRLICGDATDPSVLARLMDGDEARTVVFDPPYDAPAGVLSLRPPCRDALVFSDHRHLLDCVEGWPPFRCQFVWDCCACWHTPGQPLARHKTALWFGRSRYAPDGWKVPTEEEEPRSRVVRNTRGSYRYTNDPRGKRLATLFRSPITSEYAGHAHAKPIAWIAALLGCCTNGPVLDPFAGSGTSIIACELLGRRCLAVEIAPNCCDVILDRWQSVFGGIAEKMRKK